METYPMTLCFSFLSLSLGQVRSCPVVGDILDIKRVNEKYIELKVKVTKFNFICY